MGEVLENGVYLPDEGERNAYNGLKGNWNTVDTVVAQVQALSSTGLIRKPVDELPTEDIETNVIYMLKAVKPNGDVYRIEYMYIDGHWDALGTSETTLDDYYTKAETDDLPAVKSGINATRVSNYDAHLANNDIHVTLANKATWDGKQNALDTAQTAAVNSGVTAAKVTGYDTHVSDTDIHVTTSDKAAWNAKQDGLSQTQLAAVNSGITEAKRTGYDSHVADTDVHVTTADKAAWNGKQNALTQTQLDNIAAVPDKANSADLATVATTGDYGDLLNAPAIPTVNNATLTIQKNGTDVATFTANASSNVTANLAIPTKTSELDNDAGFLTQHNPIDNELSATSENALQNKVVKSELDGKAPLVHTHAASDITSGTFNIARIPNLDASKITSGTIDIARLPKGALERLVKVANQAARYALTTDDVQLGDTVQQLDTGVMYVVTDETKLDSADGYTEFTAGAASSVPWTGVTGKPNDYPPSSHTHTKSQITDFPAYGTTAGTICEGNDSRLSDARTPVAHTHTKSDVTDLFNSANTWSANNQFAKINTIETNTVEWHNSHYRGINLISDGHFANMAALLTAIRNQDWSDIYIGDYVELTFTYEGASRTVKFYVGEIDKFYKVGDASLETHHLVMVTGDLGINQVMNDTNTTAGGYAGSKAHTVTLPALYAILNPLFNNAILTHREHLSNTVLSAQTVSLSLDDGNGAVTYSCNNFPVYSSGDPNVAGCVTAGNWYDCNLVLMSEIEMFGSNRFSSSGMDDLMCPEGQIAAFKYNRNLQTLNRTINTWLRNVNSASRFCGCGSDGFSIRFDASYAYIRLRPRFLIG